MELLTISEFKKFCDSSDYDAEVFLIDNDWSVRFTSSSRVIYLSHSRNKDQLRKFKTLDSVFKTLFELAVFIFTVDCVLNPINRAE